MAEQAAPQAGAPSDQAPVFDETARVVSRERVGRDTFEVGLRCPRIAAAARAGQFVNVLVPGGGYGQRVFERRGEWRAAAPARRPVLLRRPFSVYRAYASDGGGSPDTIDLLIKVVGEGTRRLAAAELGTELAVLGPLGRPFALPPAAATAALVAGGCGWASLGMLAHELRRRGHATVAFIGAQTVEDLPLRTAQGTRPRGFLDELPESCVTSRELEELGVTVALAAEAGGQLYGGRVTDLLARFLERQPSQSVHLYACGPFAMLRAVGELAGQHGAPCQLSFEKRMACGMGVCMSCVCAVVGPDGARGHKRLCVEGPVLRADEVDWGEEMRNA